MGGDVSGPREFARAQYFQSGLQLLDRAELLQAFEVERIAFELFSRSRLMTAYSLRKIW